MLMNEIRLNDIHPGAAEALKLIIAGGPDVPAIPAPIAPSDEELLALRLSLYRNGYPPVPVSSPNPLGGKKFGKAPLFKDWTTKCARADETVIARHVKSEKDHRNTGILCGGVLGVDLDVSDESLAIEMEQLVGRVLETWEHL